MTPAETRNLIDQLIETVKHRAEILEEKYDALHVIVANVDTPAETETK